MIGVCTGQCIMLYFTCSLGPCYLYKIIQRTLCLECRGLASQSHWLIVLVWQCNIRSPVLGLTADNFNCDTIGNYGIVNIKAFLKNMLIWITSVGKDLCLLTDVLHLITWRPQSKKLQNKDIHKSLPVVSPLSIKSNENSLSLNEISSWIYKIS